MSQGRLPFSGAGVVAGLEAAVKALGEVLLGPGGGGEDGLGIETNEVGLEGKGVVVENGKQSLKRWRSWGSGKQKHSLLPPTLPPVSQQTTAGLLRSTALLPPLVACLRWVVREAQEEPPHLPLASLLGAQYWLVALLHGLAARGPGCATLVAQAGGGGVVEAVLGARTVRGRWG